MKARFFLTAILLSSFPLLSGARYKILRPIPVEIKPASEAPITFMKPETKPAQGTRAWKEPPVNTDNICIGVGGCRLEIPISRGAVKVVNTMNAKAAFGKRDQKAIQSIVKALPQIKNNMEGFRKKPGPVVDTALAAAFHSTRWNDPKAQEKMIIYFQNLAVDKVLDEEEETKLARIQKKCRLNALL